MKALPRIKLEGKTWFVDARLCQLRNVDNPHDFVDITPNVAWAIALGAEKA